LQGRELRELATNSRHGFRHTCDRTRAKIGEVAEHRPKRRTRDPARDTPCKSSETLAGRIETVTLSGFGTDELGADPATLRRLWRRGGFPPAYLARSERESYVWRQQFIQTYLERNLPQLGITTPAPTLLRFWTMLAHYHGGIWNAAEAAYFWATHTGAELDLLLFVRGGRYGVEVKFQDAPQLTPSMRIALEDLGLRRLTVLYPGDRRYPLERRVDVVPLAEIARRGADAVIGRLRTRRPKA
jgi:predicted AAA+ superfamily ATPase